MYKAARNGAGMTIDQAACLLYIAPRTLAKYESGGLKVPPETVCRMGQIYNVPELPLHHCSEKCTIGCIYHPTFDLGDVATGTLQLMSELQDVNERMGSLVSIAADGQITPEELPEFEVILKELTELGQAIERMKLLGPQEEGNWKGDGTVTFPLDLSRSLEPEEMEDIMGHPAVLAISERVVRQPEVGYQVADAMLHIFSALEGHNPLVALLAALKVAGVLAANADDEVERIWRRRNFKVIEGGGGIAGSAS